MPFCCNRRLVLDHQPSDAGTSSCKRSFSFATYFPYSVLILTLQASIMTCSCSVPVCLLLAFQQFHDSLIHPWMRGLPVLQHPPRDEDFCRSHCFARNGFGPEGGIAYVSLPSDRLERGPHTFTVSARVIPNEALLYVSLLYWKIKVSMKKTMVGNLLEKLCISWHSRQLARGAVGIALVSLHEPVAAALQPHRTGAAQRPPLSSRKISKATSYGECSYRR